MARPIITTTIVPMRKVQAARYERCMGYEVCTHDDEITDFNRTIWHLWGFPVWCRDHDHVAVPMHTFIADCLGMGKR